VALTVTGCALCLAALVRTDPTAAVLGGGVLLMLLGCYLRALEQALLVWSRHIEVGVTLSLDAVQERSGASRASVFLGQPLALTLTVRNRSPRSMGELTLMARVSSTLCQPAPLRLPRLSAGATLQVSTPLVPEAPGLAHLHGIRARLGLGWGLFALEAYFPLRRLLLVLPRQARTLLLGRLRRRGIDQPEGRAPRRHKGEEGALRELRDRLPGDPSHRIAWRASARLGRLVVRELEPERQATHWLLVDVGPAVRRDEGVGAAIERALGLASELLAEGHRVGLLAFDGLVQHWVSPESHTRHLRLLLDALVPVLQPVDEESTDCTDSELLSVVATDLRLQTGQELRARRPASLDDPSWAGLGSTPAGELVQLPPLLAAIERSLQGWREQLGPSGRALLALPQASTSELARLRLYCRLNGIELPARLDDEPGRAARGLAGALERLCQEPAGARLHLLSPLEGLEAGLADVERALARVRARRHSVELLLPPLGSPFARRAERPAAGPTVVDALAGVRILRRAQSARTSAHRFSAWGVSVRQLSSRRGAASELAP
jgi:uncharacterized protein (DUF58 family)